MSNIVKPADVEKETAFAVEARRLIHRHPEIGLCLEKTERVIVESLKGLGIDEIHTRVGGPEVTGTVAVIRGNRPGRTIGLRADGDALPLKENTGAPYASEVEGCMHACGHDGHTAVLLGVCAYFSAHRDFAGTLVAVFQPGEEGYAGGRFMIEDGLVENFGIEEFYALHSDGAVDLGKVAFIAGHATANSDIFSITFEGKGGHGSKPHLARDPVVAACEAVVAMQTIVSRSVKPDMTAVLSICSLQAGNPEGSSVIPQKAVLHGTVRTYETEVQELVISRMKEIVDGVAHMNGMKAEINYTKLYPAMYDDPDMVAAARPLAEAAIGKEQVVDYYRTPGGEDFSFMLQKRPGCLFRLGMRDAEHKAAVHNETFDFNDKAMATGISVLSTIALSRMEA